MRTATVGRVTAGAVRAKRVRRPIPKDALAAAFARVIGPAGAKARRYDESGGNAAENHTVPISRASTDPFLLPVARDMLAVDCDKPELLDRALELKNDLRAAGLRPVTCDSGPVPGRVHLYALIENDPAAYARWERRARDLGFDPRPYIRPPFALHRDRKSRSIPRDLDPQAALAMLTPSRKRPKPSKKIWGLLKRGEHPTEYRKADGGVDRSAVLQAIMVAFVAAGYRYGAIRTLLESCPAISKLEGRGDAEKILRSSFDSAVRYVQRKGASRCSTDVQEAVARERARASAERWAGTGGGSRLALLNALHEVALRAGRASFTASVRQLAEAATVGLATASRNLDRLVQDGWIIRTAPSSSRTTCWALPRNAPYWNSTSRSPLSPTGTEVVFHLGAFSEDAARFGGVGKQRLRVWSLVKSGATTVRMIAAQLGIREAGARKHVAMLVDLGLLVRRPHRQLALGDVKLQAVAEQLGVAGVGALQRSKHEAERELRLERFLESKSQKPKNVPVGVTPYIIRSNSAPTRSRVPVQMQARSPAGERRAAAS